eukprot:5357825-Amphidinium_carterae.1
MFNGTAHRRFSSKAPFALAGRTWFSLGIRLHLGAIVVMTRLAPEAPCSMIQIRVAISYALQQQYPTDSTATRPTLGVADAPHKLGSMWTNQMSWRKALCIAGQM